MKLPLLAAGIVCLLCAAGGAWGEAPPTSLFDPAKDIHVADVHRGMTGYGLSVFSGTAIEKFDVEVIDVAHNFNPKFDAILVRCKGPFLEHTGAIEGMSGSPIYLFDAAGKPKLAGAFAYGWPLSKDPIGGVQPIEYMLALPSAAHPAGAAAQAGVPFTGQWSLLDAVRKIQSADETQSNRSTDARTMLGSGANHLEPLKTPLMVSGISAQSLAKIAPLFAGTGLVPMQAGGAAAPAPGAVPPKFEPGSVLAVPLLTGDADMTAIGTCTEVVGDRMFGFGHPFNGDGPIALPMGTGSIAMVVANLESSFKLGFLSTATGTLSTDQTVGVAGQIGANAPMIPIDVQVIYDDHSVDSTYHFKAALHPKLTPAIAAAAVQAAINGNKNLPEFHTLNYDLTMDFANGQSIHAVNTSVNAGPSEVAGDLSIPITLASQNPFKQVSLKGLHVTVHVASDAHEAQILSVMVAKLKYEPGDTVKAFVNYQPFRADEQTLPVELQLPRDLPNGTYQLTVSDWSRYSDDERNNSPFKFTANNIDEVFSVLRYMTSIQHNAVYLRLVQVHDGIAVGRTAMPRLPSSQRQVLMDAGRSDILPFYTSTLKIVPTDVVMDGSADFTITIERKGKVEVGPAAPAPAVPNALAAPAGAKPPTGKADNEPKAPQN